MGSVRNYDDLASCVTPATSTVAPEMQDQGDARSNSIVESCPYFRNEIGSDDLRCVHLGRATVSKQLMKPQNSNANNLNLIPHPICNSVSILDAVTLRQRVQTLDSGDGSLRVFGGVTSLSGFVLEHLDLGAHFYRDVFVGKPHRNLLANHPVYGPIAVSLLYDQTIRAHRLIVRTSDMLVLRGTLPDDCVPTATPKHQHKGSSKQKPSSHPSEKDVLSMLLPELNDVNVLRPVPNGDQARVEQDIVKIDEQNVRYKYKIGVIYCRPGQSTEEEFYNNAGGSELFDDFLGLLGRRVRLRGFTGYSGGLDTRTDTTGLEAIYSKHGPFEILYHVSTLLPLSPTNRQQLLRKRHIGNDVVTIVFQEPGCAPFTPRAIRSQYQHVFIVVRPLLQNGRAVAYQVAVSRAKDSPSFGPLLPPDGVLPRTAATALFLATKSINAENAVVRSGKFVAMSLRTRRELLLDLVHSHATIDQQQNENENDEHGSGLASAHRRLMSRLSFRRVFRDKTSFLRGSSQNSQNNTNKRTPFLNHVRDLACTGGYAWNVVLVDCGQYGRLVQSTLLVSSDEIVVIDRELVNTCQQSDIQAMSCQPVVICIPLRALLGFRLLHSDLRLFYHKGESLLLRSVDGATDELDEIVRRLCIVSGRVEGVDAVAPVGEIELRSPVGLGRFGFLCSAQGVVLRVDDGGPASQSGLRPGCRIIEVFGVALRALTGAQLRQLFQSASHLRLSVLPALPSGQPRHSRVNAETPTMYWLPSYFHSTPSNQMENGQQPVIEDDVSVAPATSTPKLHQQIPVSTPVQSFAANQIYAELPLADATNNSHSHGGNKSNSLLRSTDSLVDTGANSNESGSVQFFTPLTGRRNGTQVRAVAPNSNYQLHRWPQTDGQQQQQNKPEQQGSNSSLLEAQLAVERSRRLAAEHELAEAKAQLTEMRRMVKQFTDWFSSSSPGSAGQAQQFRQFQAVLGMNSHDDSSTTQISG